MTPLGASFIALAAVSSVRLFGAVARELNVLHRRADASRVDPWDWLTAAVDVIIGLVRSYWWSVLLLLLVAVVALELAAR